MQTNRLVIGRTVRIHIVSRVAVFDRCGYRQVREERGTARGNVYRTIEIQLLAERDTEVIDPDADILKFQNTQQVDLIVVRGRGRTVSRLAKTDADLGGAQLETVRADHQAGDLVARDRRVGIELGDPAADSKSREQNRRRLDADQLLVHEGVELGGILLDGLVISVDCARIGLKLLQRLVVYLTQVVGQRIRIFHVDTRIRGLYRLDGNRGRGLELNGDAFCFDGHNVGYRNFKGRHAEAEVARYADSEVSAQQTEHVDTEGERSQHADHVGGDSAGSLLRFGIGPAPERQARPVASNAYRQHQHSVLEANVFYADIRTLEHQRAELDGLRTGLLAFDVGLDGELFGAGDVSRSVLSSEGSGAELDEYLARGEQVDRVCSVGVLEVVAVGRTGDELGLSYDVGLSPGSRHHHHVGNARAGQREFVAVDRAGINRTVATRYERDVNVSLSVERSGGQGLSVGRAAELCHGRRRRQLRLAVDHDHVGQGNVFGLAEVRITSDIPEGSRQVLDRQLASIDYRAGEAVPVRALRTGHKRRTPVDRHADGDLPVNLQRELGRIVGNAGTDNPQFVRIVEDHVDITASVQFGAIHNLAAERILEVRGDIDRRFSVRRRDNPGVGAEYAESIDSEALQAEAVDRSDREAGASADGEVRIGERFASV